MNNLLFFNKDGYPHNFKYNQDTLSWDGKILFDENSDQTFKTQSLHIFESVDPIDFTIQADLKSMIYNNNSGMTFKGETIFKNEQISNIKKVNDSNIFYSKWVFGVDFHKKFPIGTIVQFNNISGNTSTGYLDFTNDQFYTVLSIKKNAILIITNTPNNLYNFSFVSGTISSLNMISINNYNQNLINNTLFQNFYTNKKISVVNSLFNDKVISVKQSGITFSYINDIELSGNTNQFFTLKVDIFTERPKLFQNNISIYNSKYMNVGKYANLLAPDKTYISSVETTIKKEVTFEDDLGNKLFGGNIFTIDSLVTSENLGEKSVIFKRYYDIKNNNSLENTINWNCIIISGVTNIYNGDNIKFIGVSGNTLLMNNRELSVVNKDYNTTTNETILFVSGYIIEEENSIYTIHKLLKPNQINTVEFTSSGDVSSYNNTTTQNCICYTTSNSIQLNQAYLSGITETNYESTIISFISKYRLFLNQNGIDCYYTKINGIDYLSIESLYGSKYKYFSVSGYTNNTKLNDNFTLSNFGITEKYNIITNEKLIDEHTNRSSDKLYNNEIDIEILLNLKSDNDKFGFKLTINNVEYSVSYKNNTQDTINEFIHYYDTIFAKNGYILNSGYSFDYSEYTLNITTNNDVYDLKVLVNILSTYKILDYKRNNSILLSANEITSLSTNLFDLNLSTGMIISISGSNFNFNNREYNIIYLSNNTIGLSYEGIFENDNNIQLFGKTREFLRKPRGDYYNDTYLKVFWEEPYDGIIDDTIFLYDVSGNQLKPYNNIESLTYNGQKPLINSENNNIVFLNYEPNKDLKNVNNPKFQQTVFDELLFKLDELDSSINFDWIPEPLEIFIGYNSNEEGVNFKNLKIEKIIKNNNSNSNISFSGYTSSGSTLMYNNFVLIDDIITYKAGPGFNFNNYGFKKNQKIKLFFKDQNINKQEIFENINTYKILEVNRTTIKIDSGYTYPLNSYDTDITYNSSGFTYFNTTGSTFYFNIEVQPETILNCVLYGQTEIEDIRLKVNLNNLGVQLEDDIYEIFYQSDIQDNAIDYTLMNKKRKEMLSINREIYDYIGSYKSLINSINFFGFNDLLLYEYYKNIDKSSPLYGRLQKVLIPDIFDNSVKGWNERNFINQKYINNISWKKTNLFNLAYNITDNDGNNILVYSLDEIQYKLGKLKKWLRKNIIPVSSNLLDITGVSDTNQTLYQDYDESSQTKKYVVERKSTVVNFNYTATLNFGTNYLITINFYTMSGNTNDLNINNEPPQSFSVKIKTYYLSGSTFENPTDLMIPVQYFKVFKNDLKPFSFTLNKNIDPYIYIETTTYDNGGNGIGYINNKMFYFDEPRNYWLVNNNFDLSKMKYYQTSDFTKNKENVIIQSSTILPTSVETIVNLNTLNNTYISKIPTNNK